jgi:hypothetical protein
MCWPVLIRTPLIPCGGKEDEANPMKRHWITYNELWRPGPMSYWVHIEADGKPYYYAKVFEPPLPRPVPGKGYPYYHVEIDDFTFEFASLEEIDVCISTLSQKHLPSTDKQTDERRTGPDKHWLNKLPAGVHAWRYRSKAVDYLRKARADFAKGSSAK